MPVKPPSHRAPGARTRAQVKADADAARPTAAARGYGGRWRKARLDHLAGEPLCRMCAALGVVREATVVDHVVAHRGDEALFWDRRNWQSLCAPHHDRDKQRAEATRA